jgi:hypothetical protein
MAIYKTDFGDYVISSRQVWMPGTYEDERTAKYAFKFRDEELREIHDSKEKNEAGLLQPITFKDLQEYRKKKKVNQ